MVAIALALGALTLGAPTQKAAASLAQKSPTQINLAAPFWESWGQDSDPLAGVDRSNEATEADPVGTWTNSVDDCPDWTKPTTKADKIKEVMKKLNRKSSNFRCAPGADDVCDANDRKAMFTCMDKDSSGTVDKSEVEAMCEAAGVDKDVADMMMVVFDTNGDGTLSAKEVNDVFVCMEDGCAPPSK